MPLLLSNQTPGGPVDPEEYAGEGVSFAADSALTQGSAANTSKLTLSMWVKRSSSGFMYLFRADAGGDPAIPLLVSSPGILAGTDLNIAMYGPDTLNNATLYNTVAGLTSGVWHHVFISIDLAHASGAKLRKFYLDGEVWAETNDLGYPIDPGAGFTISGSEIGFPTTLTAIEDEGELEQPAAAYSDVQIWTGLYLDPTATQTTYSAKAAASRIVRDVVNYMNTRGVSPVDALAVMKIESNFGRLSRNVYQFLDASSFNSILGYSGSTTNNTDLNRALANAWTSLRPSGSAVPAPNNYSTIVRNITGIAPLGWQKFVIHNLGGSVSAINGPGSINGYRLLSAWIENDDLTLAEVGGLTLMTAQTSIYGSTGPIGEVDGDTTVGEAIGAMTTVWDSAVTAALALLDANTQSNLSYFIDDDGLAVPPAAATDKFGLQTFLFTGNAEDFIENEGSGGDVSLVGSVSDVAGPNG